LTEDTDEDADGNPDGRIVYTYDSQGNMLTKELDQDVDGVAEERELWSYDSQGKVLTEGHDGYSGEYADGIMLTRHR
jgi:YD repeat-containing protein